MPLAQDTTASSNLPTVRKTGLSITLIRSPETAATIFAHRVSSASPSAPTARRTSVDRYRWAKRCRNPRGKCFVTLHWGAAELADVEKFLLIWIEISKRETAGEWESRLYLDNRSLIDFVDRLHNEASNSGHC